MRNIDDEAIIAKNDPAKLESFITGNKAFILKCAYKHTKRYITDSDDEYSISLSAFADAVKGYEKDKGSFMSFAENVISHKLIDYYRSQSRYNNEIQVDPHDFDTEPEEDDDGDVALKIAIAGKVSYQTDDSLKLEIEASGEVFKSFGFRFFDLVDCSPKAEKTKVACAKAINYIIENKDILNEINKTKTLPIKTLEKNTELPRKILERHRKYIIAAVVILSGDYPYLAEYMRSIRKG
jgi:RNA polymerase sigma factor